MPLAVVVPEVAQVRKRTQRRWQRPDVESCAHAPPIIELPVEQGPVHQGESRDPSQTDLLDGQKSGLTEATSILSKIKGISIVNLSGNDVVRHHLVAKIIDAYQKKK